MRKDTRERPRSDERPAMVLYFENAHDRQQFFNEMVDGIGRLPLDKSKVDGPWKYVKTWGSA